MTERQRNKKGQFVTEHGMRWSKLYGVWCAMKNRCNNPKVKGYKNYGAKGVKVCKEWEESFKEFCEWALSEGYREGLTIDRIDNNEGYCPANCRWVTQAEQNRNYGRNHMITYNGETKCLADWADELGINRVTLYARLKRGKTVEQAFNKNDGRAERWKETTSANCSMST